MVYEIKCDQCGKLIEFGGEGPDDLPENVVEFNDNLFCRECVKDFVEFGTGDIISRIDRIDEQLSEVRKQLGFVDADEE